MSIACPSVCKIIFPGLIGKGPLTVPQGYSACVTLTLCPKDDFR